MTTIKFSEVPLNKTFTYNGVKYIKDRNDKAQEWGTCKVRKQFSSDYPVEYDGQLPIKNNTGRWQDDPATERQLNYLAELGAEINRPITKGEASKLIESIKNGEDISWAGFETNNTGAGIAEVY
jgi:hypothetical protein